RLACSTIQVDLANVSPGKAYRALLADLERVGPPASQDDRVGLLELLAGVQRLLQHPQSDRKAPGSQRSWVELNCVMGGQRAATVENGILRAQPGSAVRQRGRQLVCGRCGGPLTSGERGLSYVYSAAANAR